MPRRRTLARLAGTTTLVAGCLGLAPQGVGGQAAPGPCSQPYGPVYFDEARPSSTDVITWPTLNATVVPQDPIGPPEPIDSDGDGTGDTVTVGTDSVTLARGDGDLTLTVPGATLTTAGPVGDIDGDGRDEFQVQAISSGETFLIPGTTAAGTVAAADAGITFGPRGMSLLLMDDGSGRLVATRPTGTPIPSSTASTVVLVASVVLDLGPGGDASSMGSPVDIELPVVAALDLGDPVDALFLAEVNAPDNLAAGEAIHIVLVRGEEVTVLTTRPAPLYVNGSSSVAVPEVLSGPDGLFLRLTQSSRSGTGAYLWSLTDPCTALQADVITAAPPAAPVEADARFTG